MVLVRFFPTPEFRFEIFLTHIFRSQNSILNFWDFIFGDKNWFIERRFSHMKWCVCMWVLRKKYNNIMKEFCRWYNFVCIIWIELNDIFRDVIWHVLRIDHWCLIFRMKFSRHARNFSLSVPVSSSQIIRFWYNYYFIRWCTHRRYIVVEWLDYCYFFFLYILYLW